MAPRDRLSGAGLKPVQAAAVKSRGGERWIKSVGITCAGEHPRDERKQTLDDASKAFRCHQNRRQSTPPGQVCRTPDYWADDGRRRGGMKRMQAVAWNCMNQALDAKGEAVAVKTVRREYRCQGLGRADPYERGRLVMGLEQRDRIRWSESTKQLVTG